MFIAGIELPKDKLNILKIYLNFKETTFVIPHIEVKCIAKFLPLKHGFRHSAV